MHDTPEVLFAHIERGIWLNDRGLSVFRCKDPQERSFQAVGRCSIPIIAPGMSLTLKGSWQEHPDQRGIFAFEDVSSRLPIHPRHLAMFLCQHFDMDSTLCTDIAKRFGKEFWSVVTTAPHRLNDWVTNEKLDGLKALIPLFEESVAACQKGNKSPHDVRESSLDESTVEVDPFYEYLYQSHGYFKAILKSAVKKLRPNDPRLIRAAIVAAVRREFVVNGWTAVPLTFLYGEVRRLLNFNITRLQFDEQLSRIDPDLLCTTPDVATLPALKRAENDIFERIYLTKCQRTDQQLVVEDHLLKEYFSDWESGIRGLKHFLKNKLTTIFCEDYDTIDYFINVSTAILRSEIADFTCIFPFPINAVRLARLTDKPRNNEYISFSNILESPNDPDGLLFDQNSKLVAEFIILADLDWCDPQRLSHILSKINPNSHVLMCCGPARVHRVVGAVGRDIANLAPPYVLNSITEYIVGDSLSETNRISGIVCNWQQLEESLLTVVQILCANHKMNVADIQWLVPSSGDASADKRRKSRLFDALQKLSLVEKDHSVISGIKWFNRIPYTLERHYDPLLPGAGTRLEFVELKDEAIVFKEYRGTAIHMLKHSQLVYLTPSAVEIIDDAPIAGAALSVCCAGHQTAWEIGPCELSSLINVSSRQTLVLGNYVVCKTGMSAPMAMKTTNLQFEQVVGSSVDAA